MERKLNEKNYIAIADWMVTGFDFNTRELLCYAIIYGFSQDGESVFSGSLNYLSTWLGIRRDNVLRYLNALVEKGVVIKEKKSGINKSWCEYKVVENKGATRNSDHIIISPWMINELELKDKELILYALIHGFSRAGSNSVFSGNNAYMAKWLKVDKSHMHRYTSALIKKGLLEKEEKEYITTYKAIVPNKQNDDPRHFEYTLANDEVGGRQNEYTHSQIEDTPRQHEGDTLAKLSTNNLELNNLENNLNNTLVNNNVVVEKINSCIASLSPEEEILLNAKKAQDLEILNKYKDAKIDIVRVLGIVSYETFRFSLIYRSNDNHSNDGLELLLNTLNLKRYENRVEVINNLPESKILGLFIEACNIFDPDNTDLFIRKSPQAYFIGIVDNVLA